jgi:hypothetical protein
MCSELVRNGGGATREERRGNVHLWVAAALKDANRKVVALWKASLASI